MRCRRGFTLIELMIVVAMMAFLAAVIVPSFLRAVDRGRKERAGGEAQPVSGQAAPPAAPVAPPGAPPVLESGVVDLKLDATQSRLGMDVFTRYEMSLHGVFVVRASGTEPTRLEIRFPQGTLEARDVRLRLGPEGQEPVEPATVSYTRTGVSWTGTIPGDRRSQVIVDFKAQGRDRVVWPLPQASRTGSLKIALRYSGARLFVPDWGLQPTLAADGELGWSFENLVTDRPVTLELPAAQGPLGRVVLLSKLVAVAVLLFGLGFWYLAELYRAGCLAGFRWGHFLLLALTYSLFFVVFAVLGFHGQFGLWTNVGVALLVSVPLLMLHVSRILDGVFAFTRVLPLALFTIAIVLNGVYGDETRDYAFIAAAFVTVAFLTVTYRSFATRRDVWNREQQDHLSARYAQVEPVATTARDLAQKLAIVGSSPSTHPQVRSRLDEARKRLEETLSRARFARDELQQMRATESWEMRVTIEESLRNVEQALVPAVQEAEEALRAVPGIGSEGEVGSHCAACGTAGVGGAYCSECGTRQPRRLTCDGCGEATLLYTHLLDLRKLPAPLHCQSCGVSLGTLERPATSGARSPATKGS